MHIWSHAHAKSLRTAQVHVLIASFSPVSIHLAMLTFRRSVTNISSTILPVKRDMVTGFCRTGPGPKLPGGTSKTSSAIVVYCTEACT